MADVKERPTAASAPAGYDEDFHAWAFAQADLVRERRFSELDLPNLVEELESMGNEVRFKLESSYRLLISHLLKHAYQPSRRSRSWLLTITRERGNIERIEAKNPSLRSKAAEIVQEIYRYGRKEASVGTDLPLDAFPAECPFTLDQLRDDEFLPD